MDDDETGLLQSNGIERSLLDFSKQALSVNKSLLRGRCSIGKKTMSSAIFLRCLKVDACMDGSKRKVVNAWGGQGILQPFLNNPYSIEVVLVIFKITAATSFPKKRLQQRF